MSHTGRMHERGRSGSPQGSSSRPGIDEALAERLDRLSREDADRVLESAIRLQSQRHADETFTAQQIRHIARELGLDDSVVDRAIREEITKSKQGEGRSWPAPRRITDRATVEGAAEEVEDRIMAWMEHEEGLRPVARTPDGVKWEKDNHWLTSTRLAFGSEATKALRGMPEVRHRQISLNQSEQVVEIEVDTRRISNVAWGVGAGVTVAGIGGGVGVAAAVAGGNDLAQFAGLAVPAIVVAASSVVVTARVWADAVRRGVERALGGIAHPDLHARAARRRERRRRRQDGRGRRSGFQRLVDEVADAIEDLFD